jgi:hypothetical protein
VAAIHSRNRPGWEAHYDDQRCFSPILGSFAKHTHQLADLDLQHLLPLRQAICKRLGYAPDTIILYYSLRGEQHELMF